MADNNDIAFNIEVDGVEPSINSIKDLKTAIKAAKDEQVKAGEQFGIASKEYVKASKAVAGLKDKVDDLSDSTKSLKGSGIERASQGFSQLGEGLKNLDFDKVKVGFTAMKSAIAAVGIGLIIQAVMYLVENFDELSKGTGAAAKVFQFVGAIITAVKDKIMEFTDALGLTNSALDKQGEAIVANANKAKDALSNQTAEYDRQIAIAKASGKSAVDLEIAKQQAIIETNKALVEQTIAYVRSGGILSEEQKKLLTEQLNAIKNAKVQQTVIDLTENKTQSDNYKKHLDELKAIREADKIENEKRNSEYLAGQIRDLDALKAAQKLALEEKGNERLAELERTETDRLARNELKAKADAENKAAEEQKASDEQAARDASLQLTSQSLQSAQQLTDLFFEYKRNTLKKGSAEELAAAKKQFEVAKALQISIAVITGVQGVMAAYSSGSAIPIIGAVAGPAFAILAGVAAAVNIAKIARAKFDGGGGGGGGSAPASVPSLPIPAPPSINTPSNNTNTNSTFDENGNKTSGIAAPIQVNVKAQVVETEMTEKQDNATRIKNQSTF